MINLNVTENSAIYSTHNRLMPEEVTVTAGEELLTEKKDFRQMKNVSTIIIHPGFNGGYTFWTIKNNFKLKSILKQIQFSQ